MFVSMCWSPDQTVVPRAPNTPPCTARTCAWIPDCNYNHPQSWRRMGPLTVSRYLVCLVLLFLLHTYPMLLQTSTIPTRSSRSSPPMARMERPRRFPTTVVRSSATAPLVSFSRQSFFLQNRISLSRRYSRTSDSRYVPDQ